jgi:peptidoglycan/xylan/chitin deacetylase (PgdA/CDA1 family)
MLSWPLVALTAFAIHAQNRAEFRIALDMEKTFDDIVEDPAPEVALRTRLIDELLTSLYKAEADIDDFNKELDQMNDRALKEPGYRPDPLRSASYQSLLNTDAESQEIRNKIIYIYKRLLARASDSKLRQEERLGAAGLLAKIDDVFAALPEEDNLQLSELLSALRVLRTGALDASANSTLPDPEGQDYKQLKSAVRRAEPATHRKAERARMAERSVFDRDLNPLPPAKPAGRPFTPLVASAGPEGNVTGDEFEDGQWALTFDDGPDARYSPPLMAALLAHRDSVNPNGAQASFFWLASRVSVNANVVKWAVDNRFSVNCHSWNHLNLGRRGHNVRQHEVIDAIEMERRAYGRDFKFYRCPGGYCGRDREVRDMIARMGLIHASWNVDSLDWKLKNPQRTFALLIKQMRLRKHGIVLMHDIHPYSLEAARMLLIWIAEQNNSGEGRYELYTLDQAVDRYNLNAIARTASP